MSEPPPYRLEIEPIELGSDVRAIGLELMESETREPAIGGEASNLWAALLPVLAGGEPWALDFFDQLDWVREFCRKHGIGFREPGATNGGGNGLVAIVADPPADHLTELLAHFAGETIGARAGGPLLSGDTATEMDLAERGLDAYQGVWPQYLFCAVCDLESAFLTLLSERLWASEVIRRAKAALGESGVEVTRPA